MTENQQVALEKLFTVRQSPTHNEKIKQWREMFHLSQEYVANYLNVDVETYIREENGERPIMEHTFLKLCHLYDVNPQNV